jgi:hypothetical protein
VKVMPQIQIHQQYAKIGMNTEPGKQSIQQPKPTYEMHRVDPQLEIRQPKGQLEIDQSRAWDALALGGNLETMSKMYAMGPEMALQGLARIVEQGNRMADISNPADPIPEFARDWNRTYEQFDFRGPASMDNVDLRYTKGDVSINVIPGRIEVNSHPNPPVISYERGKLNMYMLQYNKVEITPPALDLKV